MLLSEEEELGLKVALLIRGGLLDPNKTEVDLRALVPVEDQQEFDYQFVGDTPVARFIPESVYDLLDRYQYYKLFPGTAPSYDEVDPIFWDAVKTIELYTNKFQSASMSTNQNRESSDADKQELVELFKKR